ncbi:MAG: DNA replication and repair protein RecF [Dehalococcoidia bacterium]|nr:DNA replication and repair protein RecF [Dehalococcoidia bacterium]
MYIFELDLTNFRNYARTSVSLHRGLNIVVGENAQGKSNLLEAIYLLSTLRSSRASADGDLVRKESLDTEFPVARLKAEVERAAGNLHLELAVVGRNTDGSQRAGKRVRLNGVARRTSDAVGQLAAVLFTTLDIDIVAGPPLLRRRYLDMMISQVDRGYLRAMQRYAKVLQQRNSLLKQIRERQASSNDLNFWDQELAHAGGIIMKARADALGHVVPEAQAQMDRLSEGREELTITYSPALGGAAGNDCPIDETEWTARMLTIMSESRDKELKAGSTLGGAAPRRLAGGGERARSGELRLPGTAADSGAVAAAGRSELPAGNARRRPGGAARRRAERAGRAAPEGRAGVHRYIPADDHDDRGSGPRARCADAGGRTIPGAGRDDHALRRRVAAYSGRNPPGCGSAPRMTRIREWAG